MNATQQPNDLQSNPQSSSAPASPAPTPCEKHHAVKILLFFGTLLLAFLIGLLLFLRPTVSESEKRELTEFPELSAESLLSGEYFTQITTWYADTYPGREGLIRTNQFLKSLFGIRTVQIIPSAPSVPSDPQAPGANPGNSNSPTDNTPIEKLGSVYVKGDTAYELYGESRSNSDRYASQIAYAAKDLAGIADVYGLIVPLSSSVNLSENELKRVGASDAKDAIDRMYGQMGDVIPVRVYETLREHNDEYLYFRTDHHWTALGAYYSYVEFCGKAGLSPIPLEARQEYRFEGFLGTLYDDAGRPPKLGNNPDTVYAWLPNGTNDIRITDKTGSALLYRGGVVRTDTDSFYANAASKYNCFIMGDHPLSEIHNETITDGSSIAVVKESFGNALVPFLVDHYEYVYVLDYRYFKSATGQKTLKEFVTEKQIPTVLFINNLTATSATPRLNEMEGFLGIPKE